MNNDNRYLVIKERLKTLSFDEISLIKEDINFVCFDTFNYDEENFTYCPLAVGLNLHKTIKLPTDEKIYAELTKRFFPVNIVKGVKGNFYRDNRKQDLLNLCNELLGEKACINS